MPICHAPTSRTQQPVKWLNSINQPNVFLFIFVVRVRLKISTEFCLFLTYIKQGSHLVDNKFIIRKPYLTELDWKMFETEAWIIFWAKVFKCLFLWFCMKCIFSPCHSRKMLVYTTDTCKIGSRLPLGSHPLTKICQVELILPIYIKICRFATTFSVLLLFARHLSLYACPCWTILREFNWNNQLY